MGLYEDSGSMVGCKDQSLFLGVSLDLQWGQGAEHPENSRVFLG
jgi:hypothetical protein